MLENKVVNMEFATDTQRRNLLESRDILAMAESRKVDFENRAEVMRSVSSTTDGELQAVASLISIQNATIMRQNQRIQNIEAGILKNERESIRKANYAEMAMLPELKLKLTRKENEYETLAGDILEIQARIDKLENMADDMTLAAGILDESENLVEVEESVNA